MRSNTVGRSRRWEARGGPVGLGALLAAIVGLLVATPLAQAQTTWSPAISLVRCPSANVPLVVFPEADPFHSGGPGAILWSGDPADCAEPSAANGPGVGIASFGTDDALGPPHALPFAGPPGLRSLADVTATGAGQIVLAGSLGGSPRTAAGVSQGPATGSFNPAAGLGGPTGPLAVTTSYRGGVAIASVSAGGKIELRLEQPAGPIIDAPVLITSRDATVTALAVNLDYRGDAIVAWAEQGEIFARELQSDNVLQPTQLVASSPPAPRLKALISDDGRAIVAWEIDRTSTAPTPAGGRASTPTDSPAKTASPTTTSPNATAPATTTTSAYLDVSEPGIEFTRPHLLERFVDPLGLVPPASGVQMVRLAYEGVIVAWTGLSDGHFVVRVAPVSVSSIRPATTVSDPQVDAMLTDMATGPRNEAIALWTSAPRAGAQPNASQQEIISSRGTSEPSGVASFAEPQLVTGPGPVTTPRIAIDPVTDLGVVVWRDGGRNPGIDYAVGGSPTSDPSSPGGSGARKTTRPVGSPDQPAGTVALVALVALLGFGVILVALRMRARAREVRRNRPTRSPDFRPFRGGSAGSDS